MTAGNELTRIREELERAIETADSGVREQLQSIEEGFDEIVDGDKTVDTSPHLDRLTELENKLSGLDDETEGETHRHITNAESLLYDYRTNLAEE